MPVRLVFIGKDTSRRNLPMFLDSLRQRYPNVSETGIQEMAKAELTKVPPRYSRYVEHLIGRDILSDDPTKILAWPHMTMTEQSKAVDLRTGQIKPESERLRMLDPFCALENTYVWRKENGWVQTVTDSDAEIIRASLARTWFRDVDRFGDQVPVRAWDLPVIESTGFNDLNEAKRFEKDLQRTKQWRGL